MDLRDPLAKKPLALRITNAIYTQQTQNSSPATTDFVFAGPPFKEMQHLTTNAIALLQILLAIYPESLIVCLTVNAYLLISANAEQKIQPMSVVLQEFALV